MTTATIRQRCLPANAVRDPESVLRVEQVSKCFTQGDSSIRAVDDISLSVFPGEFLAIMGPSGSGKSTLLHLMAGLTTPDSGRILVDNQDLAALSDANLTRFRRGRIGLVFQAYNLIPTLSAEDNIRLPAVSPANLEFRLNKLLDDLTLSHRRKHRPDALSGGEQQRVAIARAIVNDPAVVLADEPTGSLDSSTSLAICQLLRRLSSEENRAIVVVTHEPSVASWANRVVVLRDGKLVSQFNVEGLGDADGLHASYQDAIRSAS